MTTGVAKVTVKGAPERMSTTIAEAVASCTESDVTTHFDGNGKPSSYLVNAETAGGISDCVMGQLIKAYGKWYLGQVAPELLISANMVPSSDYESP